MKRYLRLYLNFFRNCLVREMEFRFNLAVWTIMDFVFLGMAFISAELVFGQVQTVAGWSKNEVLLLVFTAALFNDFTWTFMFQSFNYFSDLIRRGNLDFALLKPVNPRFLVSTRYVEFDHYLRMPFLLYLIIKTLNALQITPSLSSWLAYLLLFFLGLFTFYNFFFIIITLNFWFTKIFNLVDFFEEVVGVARYPIYVFKKTGRIIFGYLIPTIFIATFPVEVLMGKKGIETVLFSFLFGVALFLFSQWFWNFALKRYSSASS